MIARAFVKVKEPAADKEVMAQAAHAFAQSMPRMIMRLPGRG
jgi:hypothetical protein